MLGHGACVVDIVQRATSAPGLRGNAFMASEAALIPQLQSEAHNVVPLGAKHRRNGRGVHAAGHCYRYGLRTAHTSIFAEFASEGELKQPGSIAASSECNR